MNKGIQLLSTRQVPSKDPKEENGNTTGSGLQEEVTNNIGV